jgi:predicted nucleotidyltransferase
MSRNATALDIPRLREAVDRIGPAAPLFVVVAGAHLYGFPSPESDVDLRGAHLLDLREIVGLRPSRETYRSALAGAPEVDFVSYDIAKFLRLLAGKNGYALEQVLSPHVVVAGPAFERLRELAHGSLNRTLYHHYKGWARGRWRNFRSEEPKRVKTLLYVYRVLLTGLHLLRAGEVEASLPRLAAENGLDDVVELVERKRTASRLILEREEVERHAQQVSRIETALENAYDASRLPDVAPNLAEMNEFLIETRLGSGSW